MKATGDSEGSQEPGLPESAPEAAAATAATAGTGTGFGGTWAPSGRDSGIRRALIG